ncbi:hypothetical protein R5R35_013494 [Gryllus longicercus]|uniref:Uncharacterized protein n=1 Tax=Gryllus longicercus TaxID=2509291 RepID=A0AAN9VDQ3_9ORTH
MAPPPLLLALSLSLLAGAGRALWLPPGSQPLCHFELPSEARCSLQATATGLCKVQMLPRDSCFENWDVCWHNISFIENINFTQKFDEERKNTSLEVYGYKGRRFLIITMQPEETWWQVDVPEGEHNITITGLTGSLNETNPLINTVYCEGCPPPRVSYSAYRQLHKFEILVSPSDEHNSNEDVSVYMASSNETDFSLDDCRNPELKLDKEAHGKIEVTWEKTNRRYRCHLQNNMTEAPFHPAHASVEPPTWWVVGLVLLVILLALSSFVPLAIRKGSLHLSQLRCTSS